MWGYTVSIGNAVNNSGDGFEALGVIYIPEIHYNFHNTNICGATYTCS